LCLQKYDSDVTPKSAACKKSRSSPAEWSMKQCLVDSDAFAIINCGHIDHGKY